MGVGAGGLGYGKVDSVLRQVHSQTWAVSPTAQLMTRQLVLTIIANRPFNQLYEDQPSAVVGCISSFDIFWCPQRNVVMFVTLLSRSVCKVCVDFNHN